MKRFLTRAAIVIAVLAVAALLGFLYYVPPFLSMAPEEFSGPQNAAAPPVSGIADPAERAIAEHGRYLVMTGGCIGCHQVPGPQGPDFSRYLAGGLKFVTRHGTFVSRNLTPDRDNGLARRTDEEVTRVLRSGVFPDGHVAPYRLMPWGGYTTWTEEDRHAVLVYLRHLPAVSHSIPDPEFDATVDDDDVIEAAYGGVDYGAP